MERGSFLWCSANPHFLSESSLCLEIQIGLNDEACLFVGADNVDLDI